jgi:O-antigen/teichoic acid export membrane protein
LKINQIKYGVVLSYALIIVNAMYGLLMAPYILSQIGEGDYGVYKTVAAFSSTLTVLDLGIGTTVMRYTAKFRAERKTEEISNFAAMGLLEAGIMALVVSFVCTAIYTYLPTFYSDVFTGREIKLARTLFLILSANTVLVILENVLHGVITGTDHFVFANATKLALLILRIVAAISLLQRWRSAVVLVSLALLISVLNLICQLCFIRFGLKMRIHLERWEPCLFRESMGYTAAMFVQTLAFHANGNIDHIVISRFVGSAAVAVYSMAIQLFNMFESLSMAFSNLMLPTVARQINEGADDWALQQTVTKVGRMQFIVLGAALTGFLCVGRDFISLWLGEGYEDVYYLALILMVPSTFTLIQNVCLSVLRARNMMRFRTWCLVFGLIFNIVFTVVGTRLFGYYAAALGTALTILLGYGIAMNIYFHKCLGFRVLRFYADVFKRLLICLLIPGVIVCLLEYVADDSWLWLAVRIGVFIAVYAGALWFYGLSGCEKNYIRQK